MDVQQQSFGTARHGYDAQEVDIFLERVASEVDAYNRAIAEARNRIKTLEEQLAIAQKQAQAAPSGGSSIAEESISKAFIAAQRSADTMKEEARQESEKLIKEGEAKSREIVREALAEKQRILAEIERLRESCEKFRTEYLSVINHFENDAQKVMPSLEKAMPPKSDSLSKPTTMKDMIAKNDATAGVAKPAEEAPVKAVADPFAPRAAESFMGGETELFHAVDDDMDDELDDDLDIEEID
jgi:cell division initiation protein